MALQNIILKTLHRSLIRKSLLNCQCLCATPIAKYASNPKYPPSPPPSFRDIEMPEHRELHDMPKIPHYYINFKPPRIRKSHQQDIRGPERVHNQLLYKQYGIIALSAGYIEHSHSIILCDTINREMDKKRMFAVWRVDPLWKPITKKGIGKRMGGGKPNVHHYASPVKAGRIIVEIGGRAEFEEVFPFLNRAAKKMPFDALPVTYEMLQEIEKEAEDMCRRNINPFSFGYVVDNDMQGCNMWSSPRDKIFRGEYI